MLRVSAQEPIAVKQAVLANPNAFQFDTSMAQAIGGLGATVADLGAELGRRKQEAEDSLALSRAKNIQQNTDAQIKQYMVDNPDPNTWDEGTAMIRNNALKEVGQLKMSSKTRETLGVQVQGWLSGSMNDVQLLSTKKTIDDSYTAASATYAGVLGDNNASAVEKEEAFAIWMKAAEAAKSPDEIETELLSLQIEGEKLRVKNAKDENSDLITAASLVQEKMVRNVLRGEENPDIDPFKAAKDHAYANLDGDDLRIRLNRIEAEEAALKTAVEADAKRIRAEGEDNAIVQFTRGELTLDALDEMYEVGMIGGKLYKTLYKGLENPAPDSSAIEARDNMNFVVSQVQAGSINPNEANAELAKNMKDLSIPDRALYSDRIHTTYSASVGTALSNAKSDGVGLISPKYISEDGQALSFLVKPESWTAEDDKRWALELENRNNYERAIDDWHAQELKEKRQPTSGQVREKTAEIYQDYLDIKNQKLYQFELDVKRSRTIPTKAEKRIPLSEQTGKSVPNEELSSLTDEELAEELSRLQGAE
jgi:hypothetical protein